MTGLLNFQKIDEKANEWYQKIEQLGGMMDCTTNLEKLSKCVPYIDGSDKGGVILDEGEVMISELLMMKEEADKVCEEEDKADLLANF